MERITVTFYDDINERIKKRAERHGNQPIAQAIREMVEMCLKIEEAAENSDGKNKEGDELSKLISELKNLLKINMNWSLETRFLARFLTDNQPNVDSNLKLEALKAYKEKAQDYVKGLTGEVVD
jgi:hypothetical protein